MKDAIYFGVLVLAFAIVVTCHIALAYGLAHRGRKRKAIVALLVPPLAPYWGLRACMPLRSVTWVVFVALYVATSVVVRST